MEAQRAFDVNDVHSGGVRGAVCFLHKNTHTHKTKPVNVHKYNGAYNATHPLHCRRHCRVSPSPSHMSSFRPLPASTLAPAPTILWRLVTSF